MAFKRHQFRNSKYFGKDDCGDHGLTVTFADVQQELVSSPDGPDQEKMIVYFEDPDLKPWICNSTNADSIFDLLECEDSDGWTGKSVCLFNDPTVKMGSKRVGGIRVREVPPDDFNDDIGF